MGCFFVFLAMFSVMISVGWGRVAYVMLSGMGRNLRICTNLYTQNG